MRKIAVALVFIVGLSFISCGKKNADSEMKSFLNDSVTLLEQQTKVLNNVKDVKDIEKAFTTFQTKMLEFQKRAQELQKKYPNYDKNANKDELKEVESRLKKASAAYGQAVMAIMLKYKDNPEFKAAMMKMRNSMSAIK